MLLLLHALLFLTADKELNESKVYREIYESFLNRQMKYFFPETLSENESFVRPDRPDLAAFQDYLMTLDPNTGTVPSYRLREVDLSVERKNEVTKADMIASMDWEMVPARVGGRTRALMYDPLNTSLNKVWAGSVTGGLWFNQDITSAISSWNVVEDIPAGTSISCITYDPLDKEKFYVATGEPQTAVTIYRESSGVGHGIWKSDDAGNTWKLLSSTIDFAYVTDMIIRIENDTSVIYAAVVSGLYKGEYQRSMPADGLYRSKDDGETWEQVLPDIPSTKSPYAISDIELSSNGRIFLGTMRSIDGLGAGLILYSDDGNTWNVYEDYKHVIESSLDFTSNIPGRVMLATAPSDSTVVYAVFAGGGYNDAGFLYLRAFGILRSEDCGESWSDVSMPVADGSWAYIAWHALEIAVNPSNPDHVYVGGLDLFRSLNGGETWNRISYWNTYYGTPYVHADQHNIQFKPGSDSEFIVGNDGGVFYTPYATASNPDFYERNNNYNTVQYYTCAIHPQAGKGFYLGGTQDNGTFRYFNNPVSNNDMISGGDGAFCFIDEDEPQFIITSVYYNRYYVFVNGPGDILGTPNQINDYYSGTFINPADYNNKTNSLFANATTFEGYRTDEILRIKNITTNPAGEYISLNTGVSVPFSHVKISDLSPVGETTLFLGTQSGRLFRVENAESYPHVEEIGPAAFPTANISCIAIGDTEDDLLVVFSNFGVSSVWLTIDGGLNWKEVEGNLPDMPVRWVLFYPGESNGAIIATEKGIWTTTFLDQQTVFWSPDQDGMGDVRVDMIRLRKSDYAILAATHGRGFSVSFSINLGEKTKILKDNTLEIWPNPTADQFAIRFIAEGSADVMICSMDGKQIAHKLQGNFYGELKMNFNLEDQPSGIYLITVSTGMKKYTGKLILR